MSFTLTKIYEVLPALHRIRDTEHGIKNLTAAEKAALDLLPGSLDQKVFGPLKSLLSVIADQVAILEEDLDQLYDDQFIETCAEWAVSYIGELVGARGLVAIDNSGISQRSEVANTIGNRRRKGTASVIEQLAFNVTGWQSNVVEYFQHLATTQYMNHIRPKNISYSSLKNWKDLEYSNTPFDQLAHTVDVRRIESQRGLYNIQNIGIFLWRLRSYSSTQSPAYVVDERRFLFDPLGIDQPLYNLPETEETITHLAEPINVPMPISRRLLYEELETYYGEDKSIMIYDSNLLDDGAIIPENIPPSGSSSEISDLIKVCNLSDEFDGGGILIGWKNMPTDKIAIDPVLGRIAFPSTQQPPGEVHVTYHYGFSADVGGGEYGRSESFSKVSETQLLQIPSVDHATIQSALDHLQTTGGVVEIINNEYYFETPTIRVAAEKTIEIRAVNGKRPILVLDDYIDIEAGADSSVILNGLLIAGGGLQLADDQLLSNLRIEHCTLLPALRNGFEVINLSPLSLAPELTLPPRIILESRTCNLEVEKSIIGSIRAIDGTNVKIKDSFLDAGEETAIAFSGIPNEDPGGTLELNECTIIGKVKTILMKMASNCIFIAEGLETEDWPVPIIAQRLQQGCVRFSYFPPNSQLPRPYRCQPESIEIAARVRPIFTSLSYGHPAYGQLDRYCAEEINTGADDESEMGAYHHLFQSQRVLNLRTRLNEYLRFGMEAGIFFAS